VDDAEWADIQQRQTNAVTEQADRAAREARRAAIIAKGVPSKNKINNLPIDAETKGILLDFRVLIKALLLGEDEP
jgi:hypothetical protein